MITKLLSLLRSLKKTIPAMLALLLLAPVAPGQSVQTLLSFPGAELEGVAVDFSDNTIYTLWLGQQMSPVIAYNSYLNVVSGSLEAASSPFVSPSSAVVARGGLVVAVYGISPLQWVDRSMFGAISNLCPCVFTNPVALAVDKMENLYVADANGIYRLDATNGVTALGSGYGQIGGIAVDDAGQIWVADSANDVIKLVQISGTNVTVAGKLGIPGFVDSNITGTNARFNQPGALFWAGGQTGLLVADYGNNAIRNVAYSAARKSYTVGTIATNFSGPTGVAIDNEGIILVADSKSGSLKGIYRDAQPMPFIQPPSGSYSNSVTATFSTTLLASFSPTFHYTLDGSIPLFTSASAMSVFIDGGGADNSKTVNLRTFSPDLMASPAASVTYSFVVSTPTMEPPGASNNAPVMVTLRTDTVGATLYWTINGSDPSPDSANVYTNAFLLARTGNLKVKGFRDGYAPSPLAQNRFFLNVSDPVIVPQSFTNNNDIQISMFTETPGATIHYTIDGSFPNITSASYSGSFMLSNACVLRAKGFRDGFDPSSTVTENYALVVSDPVIRPLGASNDNPVQVTISTATVGASIYWTLNDSAPITNSTPAVITIAKSGTLTVKAFKDGYTSSTNVSAAFNLFVDAPQVDPGSMRSINSNNVSIRVATDGATLHYTVDGTMPNVNSPVCPTNGLPITTNTTLSVIALRDFFAPSAPVVNTYEIQVDAPVMNPAGGYFPDGGVVSFSVQRTNASIYYTSNGQDPTPADTLYTGPFRVDQVLFPGDLRVIKARAFAPGTLPSAVITGRNVETNSIGVPRDMVGGIGSTLVVPVVANLVSNQQIRSLQFRLEVVPSSPGAPPMTDALVALEVSTNDFVPAIGQSTDGKPVTNYFHTYNTGYTNGVYFYSINGNLLVRDYGLIANFKLKVPNTATNGNTYKLSILEVSGTSDAGQTIIRIDALQDRVLTVTNIHFLAGDTCVGGWYNAGDFGDGDLNIGDVATALDASLGVHQPYPFSDAFKAMDVYPEAQGIIGDGLITFLDWQHILLRSLRKETNNWVRFWTPNGVLGHYATNLPDHYVTNLPDASGATVSPLKLRASSESADVATTQTSDTGANAINSGTNCLWLRHALIVAETVTNLAPGDLCSMPVYARVLPGFSLAGLQFRAACAAEGDAPAPGSVRFVPAASMPSPMAHALSSTREAACIWPLDSLAKKPLQGSNLLGYINFQIPIDAKAGQRYSVQLLAPDGAADYQTGLSLESATGFAWVLSGPTTLPHIISDQWKANFFGSATNGDSEADPDHDGIPNWQEYLAGTNPTNALSRLEFADAGLDGNCIIVRWQGAPGRVYVIECSTALFGAPWMPAATNACAATDSGTMDAVFLTEKSRFYRIRLQQP